MDFFEYTLVVFKKYKEKQGKVYNTYVKSQNRHIHKQIHTYNKTFILFSYLT